MGKIYTKNNWTDEVLAGAERYDIKEDGGAAFKSNMQIVLATVVSVAGTSVNASRLNNLETGVDSLDTKLAGWNCITSYVLSPSVASNNLTLAIKYMDGTDPSSTKKLYFRVGNTEYTLSAATSFTKNAATNWCNLGSNELKTLPHDLFVYAIGETGAAAGLKFGFSRIPWAKTMNDFVNTTTSEKYIAGNWTNFNATDVVTVIGRFRAQLSGGAGFTWSIPTSVVINYPIYESDWLAWTPTFIASGSMTYTGVTVTTGKYKVKTRECLWKMKCSGTIGGSVSSQILFTMPFEIQDSSDSISCGFGQAATLAARVFSTAGTPDQVVVTKYDISNYGAGTNALNTVGYYEIQ